GAGPRVAVRLALPCPSACRRDANPAPPPAPRLPVRASLGQVKGSVSIKRAAGDDWVAASAGTVLHDDDKLRTGSGASGELRFPSGTVVTVSEDTLLGIAETHGVPGRGQTDVTLLRGAVDATLHRPPHQSLTL